MYRFVLCLCLLPSLFTSLGNTIAVGIIQNVSDHNTSKLQQNILKTHPKAIILSIMRRSEMDEFDSDKTEITKENKYAEENPPNPMIPVLGNGNNHNNLLNKSHQEVKETIENEFSYEEKQDQDEFIFIKDKKLVSHNLLETNGLHSYKNYVDNKMIGKHQRVKRNDNIIVEENLGTTVVSFKYTGRNARLNNELYYKNIHT